MTKHATKALPIGSAHRSYQNHKNLEFAPKQHLSAPNQERARKAITALNRALAANAKSNADYQLSEAFRLIQQITKSHWS